MKKKNGSAWKRNKGSFGGSKPTKDRLGYTVIETGNVGAKLLNRFLNYK